MARNTSTSTPRTSEKHLKQVPWRVVQLYLTSTIALIGKVLRQPAMGEIVQHAQDAAKCTQNIQKDHTLIKNSVGLSTTPFNTANFSGRTATMTWAQVAAQAKGAITLTPPVPQGMSTTNAQSTVTAYKDRVVIVKLKDRGIAQRYRTHSPAWTKHNSRSCTAQTKQGLDQRPWRTRRDRHANLRSDRPWHLYQLYQC